MNRQERSQPDKQESLLVNLVGVSDVVDAIKQAYPYEVPIYDLIRLPELIRSCGELKPADVVTT